MRSSNTRTAYIIVVHTMYAYAWRSMSARETPWSLMMFVSSDPLFKAQIGSLPTKRR